MASHTGTVSVHATLTATAVDTVTLQKVRSGMGTQPQVTVVNRTGTDAIFFTVSSQARPGGAPATTGTDTYVVPAAITSVSVPVYASGNPVVVQLISAGAEAYSVEAL